MKKKLLALALCLVLLIVPMATIGAYAAEDPGFTADDTKKTFTITTAKGLLTVAERINAGGCSDYTIVLAADIDLKGEKWTPIGIKGTEFAGTFDGANHTIKNLSFEANTGGGAALIGQAVGCTVKDLTMENVTVKDSTYVSAIIGYTKKDTAEVVTVENVHVRAATLTATASYGYAAGIIGELANKNTKINNCTVNVTVDAPRASGIVGGDSASNLTAGQGLVDISNCIVAGKIHGNSDGGDRYGASGFFGSHSTIPVSLTNCVSLAELSEKTATKASVGSMVLSINKITLTMKNCIGLGSLTGGAVAFKDNNNVYPVSLTSAYVYAPESTEANVNFFGKACTLEDAGDFTIDGTKVAGKDAKVPVINSKQVLKEKCATFFAGNNVITAKVLEEFLGHEHAYTLEIVADGFLKTAATCTEPAVYYKSCSCGAFDKDATFVSGEGAGHTASDKWTGDDDKHWHVCSRCLEEKYEEGEHTFGDWTVVKEPTEKKTGERMKKCTVCGYEITEKLDKIAPATTAKKDDSKPAADDGADSGCGSSVIGVGMVLVVSLGTGVTCLKKKKNG